MRRVVLPAVVASGLLVSAVGAHAKCTRLPLSDVAFGREAATNAAREKLAEYAVEVAKKRGWDVSRGLSKSNETVNCKLYLNLGPFGTEYRCLVTATFCTK